MSVRSFHWKSNHNILSENNKTPSPCHYPCKGSFTLFQFYSVTAQKVPGLRYTIPLDIIFLAIEILVFLKFMMHTLFHWPSCIFPPLGQMLSTMGTGILSPRYQFRDFGNNWQTFCKKMDEETRQHPNSVGAHLLGYGPCSQEEPGHSLN